MNTKKLLTLALLLGSLNVFAAETTPAKCVHHDGYGTYEAEAATKNDARSLASTGCFTQHTELFFQSKGRYPTDDEAAGMLDVCVNICP